MKRLVEQPKLSFEVDKRKCTQCGICAKDCPVSIIEMPQGFPVITADKEGNCVKCQHCLAVCPTGAVAILGLRPEQCQKLGPGSYPEPQVLETLIKGRRSVRQYRPENLDPALVQHLMEVAWHAPTGINARQVLFTVIDDRQALAAFRHDTYFELAKLVEAHVLPENQAFFAECVQLWQKDRIDVLFRDAPHLLVATAPQMCASPLQDCLIALAYFELFAQTQGVGTVWNGLVKRAIDELVPELRNRLKIPNDHLIGYAMAFGKPAVRYFRTVRHAPAKIQRFNP